MNLNKKYIILLAFIVVVGIITKSLYSNNGNKTASNKVVSNISASTNNNFYSNIVAKDLQIKSLDNAILRFMRKWEIKGAHLL
jgi:hypothetical protein